VDAVRNAGLTAPSVLIVGPVVELRDQMAWFERKPLLGVAVGITRAEEQAESTMHAAYAWGAEPVALPLLQLGDPPDEKTVERSFDALAGFDWVVFTSQNGVRRYLDRLHRTGRDARAFGRAQIAAIGPHTAAALAEYGLRADLVPEDFRAEALAEALTARLDFSQARPPRVLWVRASRGRDVLPKELARAGAELSEVIAYSHADCTALPPDVARLIAAGRLPWIGLSSPAIARGLARLLSPKALEQVRGGCTRLAAISPITAEAAVEAGLPVAAVAAEASWEGIFRAIADVVAREHAT
jgi:uroporphyrinogen III methyltransferase/synthase